MNTPDFDGMAHYAWALSNGACDAVTQAEYDALALVEYDSVDRPARRDPMEANRG